MAIPSKHATQDQIIAAWRERYRNASGTDCGRLAQQMQAWLDAGDVSDASLRAAFGASIAAYAQIKGRMTAAAQRYSAAAADRGE